MVEPDSAEPIWKTRAACRGVVAWPVSWSSATLAARAGSIERAPVLAPGAAAERRWRRRGGCWRCVRRCGLRSGVPCRPARRRRAARAQVRLAQGLNGCEASGSPVTGSRPSSSLWMGSSARCLASSPSGWVPQATQKILECTIPVTSLRQGAEVAITCQNNLRLPSWIWRA